MKLTDLESHSSAEAEAAIRPFFPTIRLGGESPERPLSIRLEAYAAHGVTLLDYTLTGRAEATTEMPGFTVSENEIEGELTAGRDTIDPTTPYAAPHQGMTARMDWVRTRAVMLDADALQRFARTDLGDDRFELRNLGTGPVTPHAGALWVTTAQYLQDRMHDGTADSPLIGATLSQLLVGTYLHTFRTTWADARVLRSPRPVSGTVRRAQRFIDDNRHLPITAADIAESAHMSIRGLQAAFRRELDCSPVQYLQRARLDATRSDLLAADPTAGHTVAGIARRWGFVHLGRFAQTYRAAFGELPAATLRR